MKKKRDYRDVVAQLEALSKEVPGLSLERLGIVRAGALRYDFYFLTLGIGGKEICLSGGIHGDEPAGVDAVLEFLRRVRNQGSLLTHFRFTVFPCNNPYGYEHDTRRNGSGLDLNRQFARLRPPAEVRMIKSILEGRRFELSMEFHEDVDTDGYYLVGYYSTDAQHDGLWRSIRVKLAGVPGARIRYRQGYYAPKDFGVYTTEDRERQLEDAMRSETPVVELPIAVESAYFRLNNKQIFVPISAKVAASALQWAQKSGRRQVEFDFAAEIRDTQSNRIAGALRDTITVRLDSERYEELQQNALVYQGGIILPPGNYKLKFLARENESGRVGTFEDDLKLPAVQTDRMQLSSVVLSSQLVQAQKSSEVQTKGFAPDAKLKESPLDVAGERIIPSVTRVFTNQQMLYIFFQAYVPEKDDPNQLRAGLEFFRNGARLSQTPMVAPAQVDDKTHAASFRISLPLNEIMTGRYTVEAVVVQAGGAQAAFGRNYFALRPNAGPAAPPAASGPGGN